MDERAWQDEVGGSLQERAYARAGTRAVLDRQHARLAALLGTAPDTRLLDLGCGVGHLLTWLAGHTAVRGVGVDLSLNSLRLASRRGLHAVGVADAAHLPFPDATFDCVVCNGAAHHLPDLDAALREIRRVLRPGGRAVLHEPVDSPFTGMIRQTLFRHSTYESPADLAHKHAFTRIAVQESLRRAGFTDVRTAPFDFLAYPLSGMYLELPWSRSPRVMNALLALEDRLWRIAVFRPLWSALAWRVLFTARRPT